LGKGEEVMKKRWRIFVDCDGTINKSTRGYKNDFDVYCQTNYMPDIKIVYIKYPERDYINDLEVKIVKNGE
jgi:histidinol phosphatase-like enzyme